MTSSISTLNTPGLWVNRYLQEKIFGNTNIAIPFFPTSPTNLDDLTEQWITILDERIAYQGVVATYDRLIRMRRSPFPHIKCEQLLYYFYATQENVTESMIQIQEAVLRLMDRGDESAEDINVWARNHEPIDGMTCKFYFHNFKIYQLEEVRDIIDFGTARTFGGNKMILDYDYHQMQDIIESINP
jgi:hypothetical protein